MKIDSSLTINFLLLFFFKTFRKGLKYFIVQFKILKTVF